MVSIDYNKTRGSSVHPLTALAAHRDAPSDSAQASQISHRRSDGLPPLHRLCPTELEGCTDGPARIVPTPPEPSRPIIIHRFADCIWIIIAVTIIIRDIGLHRQPRILYCLFRLATAMHEFSQSQRDRVDKIAISQSSEITICRNSFEQNCDCVMGLVSCCQICRAQTAADLISCTLRC